MDDEKRRLFSKLKAQISDEHVLWAMEQIPRERFISNENQRLAYEDIALPIGESQTISQPLIVAMMTSALALGGSERVLEVGTGSGYQAAVLSLLVPRGKVITVERVPSLAKPTTEGVTRPPSSLTVTLASPPSITATTELVVPRSIPMTFPICLPLSTKLCPELDSNQPSLAERGF